MWCVCPNQAWKRWCFRWQRKEKSEREGSVAWGRVVGATDSHWTPCSGTTHTHTKALVLFGELKSRWLGHCVFVCMPPPNNTNLHHPPTPQPPPFSTTENKHTQKANRFPHTLLHTNGHEHIPQRAKQKSFYSVSLTHTFLDCQKPRWDVGTDATSQNTSINEFCQDTHTDTCSPSGPGIC